MDRWTRHASPPTAASAMVCELGPTRRRPLLDALLVDPRRISLILKQASALSNDADHAAAFAQVLAQGGLFPELPADQAGLALRSARRRWLDHTLPALAGGASPRTATRVRQAAALQTTQVLSYARLARDAQTSPSTARRYLDYLLRTEQAFLLPPLKRDLTSDAVRTPKLYWQDTGLLRAEDPPAPDGVFIENTVVSDVIKWIQAIGRPTPAAFYRTRSGRETDLVIRTPGGTLGLDVCPGPTVRPGDARSLRALAKALPRRWRGGVVVYTGEDIHPIDHRWRLWAVPAHRLLN